MRVSIPDITQYGIISDTPAHELPMGAWSEGNNVQFRDGKVVKSKGYSSVFSPSITPYWAMPVSTASTYYWLYGSLTECAVTDGTTETKITRVNASKSVSSLTRSGTTATATSTSHGYSNSDIVTISGANETDYNGTFTISNVTANTFDYTVANSPTSPATGTITAEKNNLYSATAAHLWNGGVLGGIPFVNNGVDDPQVWSPVNTSTQLVSMDWDASNTWAAQGYTAKVMRTFGRYIVYLDFNDGSTRYPELVGWSDPADAGSMPYFDYTGTGGAGQRPLAETQGFCIDCLPLRNSNIIYKEDSMWRMDYVGGSEVFSFTRIADEGILSRRCMKAFKNNHIVLTQGDIVVTDGQNVRSIIDTKEGIKNRDWLFDQIDDTNYEKCYIAPNEKDDEFLICFPTDGATHPDKALVWNWKTGATSPRDLTTTTHIAYGVVNPGSALTWDTLTATSWDTLDNELPTWDYRTYNPTVQKMLMCDPVNTKFYLGDDTEQADGNSFTSYIQREGMHFNDIDSVKFVKRVFLRMEGTGTVSVEVGSQMEVGEAISWASPVTFTIGTDQWIDCLVTGRLISLKISSTANNSWSLTGLDFDLESAGRY